MFGRKYANEEIQMTSKLFIVMAQCAVRYSVITAQLRKRLVTNMYSSGSKNLDWG